MKRRAERSIHPSFSRGDNPIKKESPSGSVGLISYSIVVVILLGLVLFPVTAVSATPEEELEDGRRWFQKRARSFPKPTVNPKAMKHALDSFEKAFKTASDTAMKRKAGGYLLLAKYLQARYGEMSEQQRFTLFKEGKKLGQSLSERFPNTVPILYGTAAHLGRWSKHAGVMSSARQGVAGDLRRRAQTISQLNPSFDGGAGHRLLARVHHKTPYIPFFLSWSSEKRALKLMRKALEGAPDHPGNNFIYGEILHANGMKQKARKYWEIAAQLTPRNKRPLVDRNAIYQSQQRLKENPSSTDS